MIQTINLTNTIYDLERFSGAEDLENWCQTYHLDGVELLPYGENTTGYIPNRLIQGVHLGYFPCWVDFWQGNTEGLLKEYGSLDEAEKRFGGLERDCLIRYYKEQLEFAQKTGARYVVFHVSDVSLEETLTYRFLHTDEQVVAATLELINAVLGEEDLGFAFLVENLWWPGFTMTRPEITDALLSGIRYPNKGIMLDTGHLLHMDLDADTQEKGVDFLENVLNRHPGIEKYIRGIHLQCGLSGGFVRDMLAQRPSVSGSYQERLGQAYEYILGIDTHEPFDTPRIRRFVERIDPEYLTHEFITMDRAEMTRFLSRQQRALAVD